MAARRLFNPNSGAKRSVSYSVTIASTVATRRARSSYQPQSEELCLAAKTEDMLKMSPGVSANVTGYQFWQAAGDIDVERSDARL
jgi:hypothetical protein